jgi:hypothetical protein
LPAFSEPAEPGCRRNRDTNAPAGHTAAGCHGPATPQWPPQAQAPPQAQPAAPPRSAAGSTRPSAVRVMVANMETTRFVVLWPAGQVAGSSDLLMGRKTSNWVPQGGQ